MNTVTSTGSAGYLNWQQQNSWYQALANAVDVFFPSLYTLYAGESFEAQWPTYARANIAEAKRLAPSKPVYPFLWMLYHNSNAIGALQDIRYKFFYEQLKTCGDYADGVVVRGGSGMTFDATKPWWRAVQDWLQSPRVKIRSRCTSY